MAAQQSLLIIHPGGHYQHFVNEKSIPNSENFRELIIEYSIIFWYYLIFPRIPSQQLFKIENLQKLIDAQLYDADFYFMSFCLWSAAIFIPNLSRDSRFFLLRTAFETFLAFFVQCIEQKKSPKLPHTHALRLLLFVLPKSTS